MCVCVCNIAFKNTKEEEEQMPRTDWSFEVVRTIPGTVWLVLKRQRHEGPRLLPHLQTGVSKVSKTVNENEHYSSFHA